MTRKTSGLLAVFLILLLAADNKLGEQFIAPASQKAGEEDDAIRVAIDDRDLVGENAGFAAHL